MLPNAAAEIASLATTIFFAQEFSPNEPEFCLFIGSGCSRPIAPSSSDLEEELLRELYPSMEPHQARVAKFGEEFGDQLIGAEQVTLETICEAYKEKKEASALDISLGRKFAGLGPSHPGYEALAHLVQERFFSIIFTTNIDELMEDAFSRVLGQKKFDIFVDAADWSKSARLFPSRIYKLHGTYSKPNPKVSWRDVTQLDPRKVYHLRHFFESHSFIFVGYSARDLDVSSALLQVDPDLRRGLPIYSFTRAARSEDMKKILRRFGSDKRNFALGSCNDGGIFFTTLANELSRLQKKGLVHARN